MKGGIEEIQDTSAAEAPKADKNTKEKK